MGLVHIPVLHAIAHFVAWFAFGGKSVYGGRASGLRRKQMMLGAWSKVL